MSLVVDKSEGALGHCLVEGLLEGVMSGVPEIPTAGDLRGTRMVDLNPRGGSFLKVLKCRRRKMNCCA
jgi:hypothetical protein